MTAVDLDGLTTTALAALLAGERPVVVLQPVGSVEPHGPHLGLGTDTAISRGAAERAVAGLRDAGLEPLIAPAVPYGVTECAAAFAGAITVPAEVLTALLRAIVDGFVAGGVAHVCLINNHLEPAHDRAVRAAIEGVAAGRASVACPLTRRWARTLSDEFRSGACHAGQYETSLMLAARPALVDRAAMASLPAVPISLSDALRAGVSDFLEMGLTEAYAGTPAGATATEGDALLDALATMVVTEVREALGD